MIQTSGVVRPEPYLTMNGVIKYMATTDAAQREKILRDYKYPDPEGEAQGLYYQPARDAIRKYHNHGNDRIVFGEAIEMLEAQYTGSNQQALAKIENNIRVIRAYGGRFGDRRFQPEPHKQITVVYEGVALNLRADMIAIDGRRMRVIRYAFSKHGADASDLRYSMQMLRFYAEAAGLSVTNADCLLLVIADGSCKTASHTMSTFEAKLRAAMREVKAIWPSI